MQNENVGKTQYKQVSAKEKYCFGIGAIGKDAICNLVGSFLMLYFTDTLYLAPAFVSQLSFTGDGIVCICFHYVYFVWNDLHHYGRALLVLASKPDQ